MVLSHMEGRIGDLLLDSDYRVDFRSDSPTMV